MYIDGYNLYYGGRRHCGSSGVPWKWFDPRAMVEGVVKEQLRFSSQAGHSPIVSAWKNAVVDRVVYCTARISGVRNPTAPTDQDIYFSAIQFTGAVDHIELGMYKSRVKQAPLATQRKGQNPQPVTSGGPVTVMDSSWKPVSNAMFKVSYQSDEEKGSDVNVGSHLLIDVLTGRVDAAIVVSNDSDLKFPVTFARSRVPIGVINPRGGRAVADLLSPGRVGASHHWNRNLRDTDFTNNQMPNPAGRFRKPSDW